MRTSNPSPCNSINSRDLYFFLLPAVRSPYPSESYSVNSQKTKMRPLRAIRRFHRRHGRRSRRLDDASPNQRPLPTPEVDHAQSRRHPYFRDRRECVADQPRRAYVNFFLKGGRNRVEYQRQIYYLQPSSTTLLQAFMVCFLSAPIVIPLTITYPYVFSMQYGF